MSILKRGIAIAAAVTALLSAACTERQAEKSVAKEWPSFQEADQDSNGALDTQEAALIAGLNFSAVDSDYNGKISESEYAAAMTGTSKQTKDDTRG